MSYIINTLLACITHLQNVYVEKPYVYVCTPYEVTFVRQT